MRFQTLVVCIICVGGFLEGCDTPQRIPPSPPPISVDELRADPFLDTLSEHTFRWFWETTDHATGLTPDRAPTRTFSSVAAIGFALGVYAAGNERGYVTRDEAASVTLNTLRFLYRLPQGPEASGTAGNRGFFYHFLKYEDGTRFNTEIELSSIDTGLLMAGVRFVLGYYDRDNPAEREIRAYADSLFARVEWDWMCPRPPLMSLGWYPERGFHRMDWHGYNEAMVMYILALGAERHAIQPEAWNSWVSNYKWYEYYGEEFVSFPPLFGHQYSHVWIDFRGVQDQYMRDRGIDYFENSRRATYANRAYCYDNPRGWNDYSELIWGLTACDGPADTLMLFNGEKRQFITYGARGTSKDWTNDDGTIAPFAAGASIPFAPEICIPALKAMKNRYGLLVWNSHGFVDAFNPSFVTPSTTPQGWFDTDQLGIDQGPMLLMAENFRSDFIWRVLRNDPVVRRGLERAGFRGGWMGEANSKLDE